MGADSKDEKNERSGKSDRSDKTSKAEKVESADKVPKTEKEKKPREGPRSSIPVPAPAKPAPAPAKPPAAPARPAPAPARPPPKPGLTDEMLSSIAQAKFEAQEDKLREVARTAMPLLRDYPKLSSEECTKKVAELRKALVKYEMQYVRVVELQEKRCRAEITSLEAEANRLREEAEIEGSRTTELRDVLEKERRRRKRYEGYEEAAKDVNKKKPRIDLKADIDRVAGDIQNISEKRSTLDNRIDERSRRAQLLCHAAAELRDDLRNEQHCLDDMDAATGKKDGSGATSTPEGPTVELVS